MAYKHTTAQQFNESKTQAETQNIKKVRRRREEEEESGREPEGSWKERMPKRSEEVGMETEPQKGAGREHKEQLEKLKQKDPEFYQFLQERDKGLLEFDEDDIEEEDVDTDLESAEVLEDEETNDHNITEKEVKPSTHVITTAMVESWCNAIRENGKISAVRSILKAFRIACHYGDDTGDDSSSKFSIMSSSVFNQIMLFVLCEMDGILRKLLGLPTAGGKKETIDDLMTTRKWKNYSHLVKSYFGNSLHVLNQMTDAEMIAFTLRRLQFSCVLLAGFPSLLRKYIKVALHFWGTGGGALPVVCFLFLRDLCVRLGSSCLDECLKGIYKAYVLNCQFVNATKLPRIQFLGNCIIELLRVDIQIAYQHAFVFIRQLAMILRDTAATKTKESFRKVYEWKFMNCLEVWTGAICAYASEADFRPLAYPLTQIISGVARLVPTARYTPLRLRCIRMLNQIAASTGTFIPVSMLLLDMLEMKELNSPPTGGAGKAVDLRTILKVNKLTLKTRAFQEAWVFSVVEELAEHLAQWCYSVAFSELSFIPVVQLRNFCKMTRVERFQKEIRQLIRQIDATAQFTNERRMSISYLPNDPAAASFLEDEKMSGTSPLSQYVRTLRERMRQRIDALTESSVLVGEHSSFFRSKVDGGDDDDEEDDGNEKGAAVFSSSWLPSKPKAKPPTEEKRKRKKRVEHDGEVALGEDVVEDLMLSSDEDGSLSDSSSADEKENTKSIPLKMQNKKQKPSQNLAKKSFPANPNMKSSMSASSNGKGHRRKGKEPKPPTGLSNNNSRSHAMKSKKRRS